MKVELKITIENLVIVAVVLEAVYNSKAITRKEKTILSIAIDVADKFNSKSLKFKKLTFSDRGKTTRLTLKHHEADILELILRDEIKKSDDNFINRHLQKTADLINQKLA